MKTLPMHRLPVGSAGCGDLRLTSDGFDLLIQFEFGGGKQQQIGAVRFLNMSWYQYTEERACNEFAPGSLDAVVEIVESTLLSSLGASADGKHHYAVFISGNGRVDVVAKSVEMLASAKTWRAIE